MWKQKYYKETALLYILIALLFVNFIYGNILERNYFLVCIEGIIFILYIYMGIKNYLKSK